MVTGLGLGVGLERLPADLVGLLPVVLVLGGIALVLAVTRPNALVVIAFALLPFVRFEPAPVDVLFLLLIVFAVATRRQPLRLPPVVAVILVALAVVTMLSMINAADFGRAVRFEGITLYLLVAAVWLTGVFGEAELTRRAVTVYIAAAGAVALYTVFAFHLGLPGRSFIAYDDFRVKGPFKDPNVWAPFLVPAAAIVLEEIARPRLLGWKLRWKLIVFLGLAAGVVFGYSRGAWLNMAIAIGTVILVYTFRSGGLRVAAKAALVVTVAFLVGFSALVATGSLNFFESRSGAQSYDQSRFGAQAEALDHVTDHAFGYGPGQVETSLVIAAHSLYVRVAFEQGLLGAVLVYLLIALTLAFAVALVVRDGSLHGIGATALLGAWLGLIVNGLAVDTLHWRHLWILAALIWTAYYLDRARRRRQAAVPGGVPGPSPVGAQA